MHSCRNRIATDVSCSVSDDQSTSTTHTESSTDSGLRFDKLQVPDSDGLGYNDKKRLFGNFVAREAFLDEEIWVSLIPFFLSFFFIRLISLLS